MCSLISNLKMKTKALLKLEPCAILKTPKNNPNYFTTRINRNNSVRNPNNPFKIIKLIDYVINGNYPFWDLKTNPNRLFKSQLNSIAKSLEVN